MSRGQYPDAYMEYLVQYHAVRDYFECHEVLEDYWKEHPDSRYSETWVMFIQLAVSLYHQRRGNMRGAVKLMRGAIKRFSLDHLRELGVDGDRLLEMMRKRLASLESGQPGVYKDLDIPLTDDSLLASCRHMADKLGHEWGRPSDLANEYMVNRHLLRDRSEVRREHEEALRRRQASRSDGLNP